MGIFNDNFGKTKFTFNADNCTFINLNEYLDDHDINQIVPVKGLFINRKSKFGDRPVLITPEYKINLPKHLMKDFLMVLASHEMCTAINTGHCGFRFYTYEKEGKTCYSGTFVDID